VPPQSSNLQNEVEKGIKDCERFYKDSGIEKSVVSGRVLTALEGAKSTLANVLPYADKTQLPVLVPVGSNNSGKSYFINNLVLADQEEELKRAEIGDRKKVMWANHFPVQSSSIGGEALTVLATKIRANVDGAPRVFLAKLVLASEPEFERRKLIYSGATTTSLR